MEREDDGGTMVVHYVAASAEAATHVGLCKRLVTLLKKEFDLEEQVPNDEREVAREFGRWLGRVAHNASAGGAHLISSNRVCNNVVALLF
jgi:hypothetical protein